jgi:cytoskeleton protein RodZ
VGEFGEKFRKEREKKGISLDDVSNVTKIGSRMLLAIEQEHFDQLPGGVFNKGFIRAYAKHLGMNDEEAVNGYLACMRQAQIDAQEAWQPDRQVDRRSTRDRRSPADSAQSVPASQTEVEELPELHLPRAEDVRPPRKNYLRQSDSGIPWRIVAVAALVVVLAIVLWTRHSRNTHTSTAASAPVQTAPVAAPVPAPPATNQTSPASPATKTTPRPSKTNTQSQTATAKTTPSAPENNSPAQASQSATPQSVTPPLAAESPAPLTLVIRASENSWISITADGQAVSQETLIAPAHTSFRASREIVAKVGNAAGVSFLWNGKEIPPDGAEAEVRTYVFTPDAMRVASAAQPPAQNQ